MRAQKLEIPFDGNFQKPIEISISKMTILNQFAPHSHCWKSGVINQ